MSAGDATENALLKLLFNATAIANVADNAASSPATTVVVALHTADPGESGSAATNVAAYTGYANLTPDRTTGGWTVTGNSCSPAANLDFGECTASPGGPITHFSVTIGALFISGPVTPNITMAAGVVPRLRTTSTISVE